MKPGDSLFHHRLTLWNRLFQSTPGYEAGRFLAFNAAWDQEIQFQSTPGYEAGRFGANVKTTPAAIKFQSTPGYEAGRFQPIAWYKRQFVSVSIHARL